MGQLRPGPTAMATPDVPNKTNATMFSEIASQRMSIQRDGAIVATNARPKVSASAVAKAAAGSAARRSRRPQRATKAPIATAGAKAS